MISEQEVTEFTERVEHYIRHHVMILDRLDTRDRDLWYERRAQVTGILPTGDRVDVTPIPYLALSQTEQIRMVQQGDVYSTGTTDRTLNARCVHTLFQRMDDLPLDGIPIEHFLPLHTAVMVSQVWWTHRTHPVPAAQIPALQPLMELRARVQREGFEHEANGALAVMLLDMVDGRAWYTVMRHLYDILTVLDYDIETIEGWHTDQPMQRIVRSYMLFLAALTHEAAETYTIHDAPLSWEQPLYTEHFLNLWTARVNFLHRLVVSECYDGDEQQTEEQYQRLQRLATPQHHMHLTTRQEAR